MVNTQIESEKEAIIARIKQIDDQTILDRLHRVLWPRAKTPEPCAISFDELRAILERDQSETEFISQREVEKEVARWR